jgi:ubiquinone biosynthesis protein
LIASQDLSRLGLADALAQAGQVLHWDHADELARLEPPVQVRRALEELGPTFVKFGQIMVGRADMFGPERITELSKLHSRVPTVPLELLRQQLREDLGGEPEELFARFDAQPLAAVSIAQVHRAQLKDGTQVVLKIRRPAIREVIEADLRLLERLIPFFPPIGGVGANAFLCQWRFHHRPVNALPSPGDAFKVVVFGKPCLP